MTKTLSRSILEATPEDILAWIDHRRNEGIHDVTLRPELCVLRTLYQYLYDYGHMETNPAESLPEYICRPADEQQYLTAQECFAYLDGFDLGTEAGLRNYTIAALLWSTGLRSAELCALQWDDIDLEEGSLLVRKGKGGRQRLLFLNDRIWEDLRRYRKATGGGDTDPVFRSLSNNQSTGGKKRGALTTSGLAEMLRGHGEAVGFTKKVSGRMFRHTFATHMLEAGVELEELQELLGHDEQSETCLYIHVTVEMAKRFLTHHRSNINPTE
jgi:site-specific recombinase XerD